MSWEEMVPQTLPCPCGKGSMTRHLEMDDWNRTRQWTEIHCEPCRLERKHRESREAAREQEKSALHEKAKHLAQERYLVKWLARFQGVSKKQAWLMYTGGSGYPALGTFYKHVRDMGIEKYLVHEFSYHFEEALKQMAISDTEINELLEAHERL
jgi:hypothetical protein